MQPTVSVIIPVYNVEKYLKECIDSVAAQTLQDIEIISIDDGSKDKSGTILDSYAETDKRFIIIHKENAGVSAARNDGLQRAQGKYVYIMDSDDVLEKNALELMVNRAEKTGADVVITDHWMFFTDGKIKEAAFFPQEFEVSDKQIIHRLQCMVLHNAYSPYPHQKEKGLGLAAPWTKLLRRDFIKRNKLEFDSEVKGIFDDGLFSLCVFEKARHVAYLQKRCYHYRVLPGSLMRGYNPRRLEINRKVFDKINEFKDLYHSGTPFTEAYYARVIKYMVYAFKSYVFNKEFPGNKKEQNRAFKEILDDKYYKEAIGNVDITHLNKAETRIVWLLRHHLSTVIKLKYRRDSQTA